MQGQPRLSRELKLVLPVDTALGEVYVHSTPISREVFERYWLVISRAHSMIMAVAGGVAAGPKVAVLALKEAATQMQVWEGPTGVERGLLGEIRRLTNVIVPADGGGWELLPLMDAVTARSIDEDDLAEIEGAVTFFILASQMQSREALEITLAGMTSLWGARTTSSSCSEFIGSLPRSTATASSGETPPQPGTSPVAF